MKRLVVVLFCLSSLTSPAQFKNIKLAEEEQGKSVPGDPSIIINQREPDNILAAMGRDRIVYTKDGGKSWAESTLTSPLGMGGNPSMIVDAKGNIYNFHRSEPEGKEGYDWIVCQRSDDLGKSWNEGSALASKSPKKHDKQGVAVNIRKKILYASWTQYDMYPSQEASCQSNVVFSMASNQGNHWDKPLNISQTPGDCSNDDNSIAGAHVTVSAEGRMYIAWANQGVIFFDRSYDEGKTWLFNDLAIGKQEGGWVLNVPGFGRVDNPPVLMIDNSPGRYHGMLFIVFADQRSGPNDTDIWIQRSGRSGDSWLSPVRINSDRPGKHQFCPAMAVDQANGLIYVVYYDRRAYDDNQTDVYLAYSTDGGGTFKDVKISETPFLASQIGSFDHTGISAHDGIITPVWTRTDSGKVSVWTAIIKEDDLRKTK